METANDATPHPRTIARRQPPREPAGLRRRAGPAGDRRQPERSRPPTRTRRPAYTTVFVGYRGIFGVCCVGAAGRSAAVGSGRAMGALAGLAVAALGRLPPETAHRAGIALLRRGIGAAAAPPADPILRVRLWGRTFAGAVGIAAGLDKDGEAFAPLLRSGAGFRRSGHRHAQAAAGQSAPSRVPAARRPGAGESTGIQQRRHDARREPGSPGATGRRESSDSTSAPTATAGNRSPTTPPRSTCWRRSPTTWP